MSLTTDLKLAYHMGYDDALAKRMPDSSKTEVLDSFNCTNSERTNDELLPCPFCGGEARIITAAGESWVLCDECKATTEAHTSRQIAIAAWNRRAK